MIHYHCADVGGKNNERHDFFKGRHLFVSFSYPAIINEIGGVCSSFAIDCGAYTAWTKGEKIDIEAYRAFIQQWQRHPSCDWHLIPDIIDGTERENAELIERWHEPFAVPVWHLHESMTWLKVLVGGFKRIAIGSSGAFASIGTATWQRRMVEAMRVICDEEGVPKTKIHGLRMMSQSIISRFPFSSVDSSNAARNSNSINRFGMYCHPRRSQRLNIIADISEQFHSPATFNEQQQEMEGIL